MPLLPVCSRQQEYCTCQGSAGDEAQHNWLLLTPAVALGLQVNSVLDAMPSTNMRPGVRLQQPTWVLCCAT